MVTKVFFPKIRLQEVVARSGGISREMALAQASANMQEISGEGDQIIDAAIARIEEIIAAAKGNTIARASLTAILEQADQIVTFAGMFGYSWLDRATRDLCDIADGLMQANIDHAAPVMVHARAVRFFAPSSPKPSDAEAEQVLSELKKIRVFYDFPSIGQE